MVGVAAGARRAAEGLSARRFRPAPAASAARRSVRSSSSTRSAIASARERPSSSEPIERGAVAAARAGEHARVEEGGGGVPILVLGERAAEQQFAGAAGDDPLGEAETLEHELGRAHAGHRSRSGAERVSAPHVSIRSSQNARRSPRRPRQSTRSQSRGRARPRTAARRDRLRGAGAGGGGRELVAPELGLGGVERVVNRGVKRGPYRVEAHAATPSAVGLRRLRSPERSRMRPRRCRARSRSRRHSEHWRFPLAPTIRSWTVRSCPFGQ